MTLPLHATVVIGQNAVHPHLTGRTGVVVHVTPAVRRCGSNGAYRRTRCGENPVVLIGGERYLLPAACVTVVEGVAA